MAAAVSACLACLTTGGCDMASDDNNLVPATVAKDESLPQLAFNGSNFHLETFGDPADPVIIILHGGPGADYRGLLPLLESVDGRRLQDDYLVVFWDQRGAGLSRRHDSADIDVAIYDADLAWLVEHFSPDQPVVLIGHSWGGMYASNYISGHPERVAGAVLMEPGPLTGKLYDEVASDIVELDFFSEWLNDTTWAYRILSPDDHERADYLFALGGFGDSQPKFHVPNDPTPFWRYGSVAGAAVQEDQTEGGKAVWDFTVGLDRYPPKVLFEASANNTAIGVEFQRRQLEFYGNAELVVIPDSGHEHPYTHPAETLRPIFDYFDELSF